LTNSLVIIPALNEEKSLRVLLPQIIKEFDVLIVNDGSIDKTQEVASKNDTFIINHETRQGYEKAIESGLKFGSSNQYKSCIVIDADGQHDPSLIPRFVDILNGGADLVCGNRNKSQRLSEAIFRIFGKLFLGVNDPLCGMRAYSMKAYNKIGYFDSRNLVGVEYLIEARKKKFVIYNFPITIRPRADSSRFGSGIKTEFKIIKALFRALQKYFLG